MSHGNRIQHPPLWLAIASAVASVALFLYLRLFLYAETIVPLTYALPLLLTLWHRQRSVHYGLALTFTLMAAVKIFLVALPDMAIAPAMAFSMMLMNIWTVALVTDGLIRTQDRLHKSNEDLREANAELEASNEELAARDEEISSQNEELQRQTEEMEHQMEELQQQSEELQRQSEDLQELQMLAAFREQVLQSLFNIATSLGREGNADLAFRRICEATAQAFGDTVVGAVLLERAGAELRMRGYCGLEESASLSLDGLFHDAFAQLVVDQAKTACVEDLRKTPDIFVPRVEGQPVRAVIAAPLFQHGVVSGAILVYSCHVREWTQLDFQTVEWLAAQGSLLLGAMKLQDELDRRSREAEAASQQKTQFLAAVSHDVRTPANAINLMAEVLEQARTQPDLAADVPDMITQLRENTRQLVELVSDVLDISRLDCGKIDLELSEFDFGKLVAGEIQHYQPLADVAGVRLECACPPQSIWLRTDRMKLIRVIENLLGNAIKFTEQGSVAVRVTSSRDGVELGVHDTGVGIPQDDLEHIFNEFFQVRNPERDRSKGTGLGLAICRRLIDALGCSLSVQSQVGKGSTFTIHMPASLLTTPPRATAVAAAAAAPEQRSLRGLRILLVEDHESTRLAVSRLLTVRGAQIVAVANAREAMQSLRQDDVDVVLLDLMLPDLDGREVLRQIQGHRPTQLRCVLVVSGDITEQRRQEVLTLGADGIVTKPIAINALTHLITSKLNT
ncbi:MAG: ATP-binding protein [Candidatus Tectimicrobiota bacterium]